MTIQDRLDQDLKKALLSRDTLRTDTLRGLKSVILYAQVADNSRGNKVEDSEIVTLLAKEAKKRQDSADIYSKAGETARADKELEEKAIIEEYLPQQLSEMEVMNLIDEALKSVENPDMKSMGLVIKTVKEQTHGSADGGLIARLVKKRLEQ